MTPYKIKNIISEIRNNEFKYFKKGRRIDEIYSDDKHKKTIEDLLNMKKRPSFIPEYTPTEIKDKYLIIDNVRCGASESKWFKNNKCEIYYKSKNYIKWVEKNEWEKTIHYIQLNALNEMTEMVKNRHLDKNNCNCVEL